APDRRALGRARLATALGRLRSVVRALRAGLGLDDVERGVEQDLDLAAVGLGDVDLVGGARGVVGVLGRGAPDGAAGDGGLGGVGGLGERVARQLGLVARAAAAAGAAGAVVAGVLGAGLRLDD